MFYRSRCLLSQPSLGYQLSTAPGSQVWSADASSTEGSCGQAEPARCLKLHGALFSQNRAAARLLIVVLSPHHLHSHVNAENPALCRAPCLPTALRELSSATASLSAWLAVWQFSASLFKIFFFFFQMLPLPWPDIWFCFRNTKRFSIGSWWGPGAHVPPKRRTLEDINSQ